MEPSCRSFGCATKQRFGGKYRPSCKYTDGAKLVCMDDLLNDVHEEKCLIYSFGIAMEWGFEDIMDDIGCKVFAYDPTVNHPSKRGNNITFTRLGVSSHPNLAKGLDTLSSILQMNGHLKTKISYLKLDIEGDEISGLPKWLSSGALDHVQQIALEFHLHKIGSTLVFFDTLKTLYEQGKYRLISYDVNGCYKNKSKSKDATYYGLAEIVLQKVSEDYRWIEKDCSIYD